MREDCAATVMGEDSLRAILKVDLMRLYIELMGARLHVLHRLITVEVLFVNQRLARSDNLMLRASLNKSRCVVRVSER